jgi:hypothetical protein
MKAIVLMAALAGPAAADTIVAARLSEPTARYDHAVLGDRFEWGALDLELADRRVLRFVLPESRVFEDITARIADLDGDGQAEVLVVETDIASGAMLTVYDAEGRRAATRPIGQTHRWLAPVATADLDGDGRIEIAYVDRPHLLRELVILHLDGDALTEIARMPGLTNHVLGEAVIRGGLRICDDVPELVLANPDWTAAQGVTFAGGVLTQRSLGPMDRPSDLDLVRAECP